MGPKRRSTFSSSEATRSARRRREESPAAHEARLAAMAASRAAESLLQSQTRRTDDTARQAAARAAERPQVRKIRQTADAARHAAARAAESPQAIQERQAVDAARHAATASKVWSVFKGAAFQYDSTIQYDAHEKVKIGDMTKECPKCSALKWPGEPNGMCCKNGKVCLPLLPVPPEPSVVACRPRVTIFIVTVLDL